LERVALRRSEYAVLRIERALAAEFDRAVGVEIKFELRARLLGLLNSFRLRLG
jgi:hypothetical protein